MVKTVQDSNGFESITTDSTTWKSDFSRETACKRRNSDCDDCDEQDTLADTTSKRGCDRTKRSIACPIAEFGCLSELPYDNLLEHYSTQIHQETLMKAIEIYVRQLHNKSCTSPIESSPIESEYAQMSDTIDVLAEGLSSLHDDNVQIHNSVGQIRSNIIKHEQQVEQLQQSIQETTQMFSAAQMNTSILQNEMEAMKQTLADASSLSANDGSYIWKITDVSEKIANAIAERQTSIYSPAFYSSSNGYKMCMRLYLNGDGNARRTHLSLFFVIMRGDYDAILQWPFHPKITFILYDQTGNHRHIIDSFRPDIKSSSFQRPKSNMNIASGIPKFFPLAMVQQENNPYVRDDCMFIRCTVDFESIPKKSIPYVVCLNPGLPTIIQQRMIQAEIGKQCAVATTESNLLASAEKTDDSKVNT